MKSTRLAFAFFVGLLALAAQPTFAQQLYSDTVGPVTFGKVKRQAAVEVPYITWGGDVATFHANGGLTTKQNSIFQKHGLNLKLVAGDDFAEQVRRYVSGQSPFLRGELRMIGLASEIIGANEATKPVVFLQLTWSVGDHMVGREGLKSLDGLSGKKIALQRGGPHVGMVDDILRTAKLTWQDIQVVWTDDLTGAKGPAELFRQDATIDACMVISPDMIGLTGGLESKGSGAEGSVKNAHVVISTASMSRSIADVYACRKDYFDANRAEIEKFAAGYLKASEEIVALRNEYNESGKSEAYTKVLKLTQQIYGEEVIPTLEVDAHGLISDATFVGLPGNVSFFTEEGNLNNFARKQAAALDLAVGQGYAKARAGFFAAGFDYAKIKELGGLRAVAATGERFGPGRGETDQEFIGDEAIDENTILTFTIEFESDQSDFSADVYGPEFLRAVEAASTFGNAVIAVRGHADPTLTLSQLLRAGMASGRIKRTGQRGNYRYFLDGKPLDISRTAEIIELIEKGEFAGNAEFNPRETMQAALNLSKLRADAVRDAVVAYAAANGYTLDASQIQPLGVGVREPVIPVPQNLEDAQANRRVEFRLLRVSAEAVSADEFDL